jgi:peptidoglycan/xylan/chitin deacetylase (PgdA/CDA1 family)
MLVFLILGVSLMTALAEENQEGLLQWYGPLIVTLEEGFHLMEACLTQGDCTPASLVSIVFDDGYASTYKKAFPILLKYQVPATVFVIVNRIGSSQEFMTLKELEELQRYGWEIASHSYSHPCLTDLTREGLLHELVTSKQVLEEYGFSIKGFAYPFGRLNPRVRKEVAKIYEYARGAYREYEGINPLPFLSQGPGSRYELKCIVVDEYLSVDQIKDYIRRVSEEGGWLILVFHKIEDVPRGTYIYPTHALQEIIRYLREDLEYCTFEEFKHKDCRVRKEWIARGPSESTGCCGGIFVISQHLFGAREATLQFLPSRACKDGLFIELKMNTSQPLRINQILILSKAPNRQERLQQIPTQLEVTPDTDYYLRFQMPPHGQTGIHVLHFTFRTDLGEIELIAQVFIKWPAP